MKIGLRRELLESIQTKYQQTICKSEKSKILDFFIAATGYKRKYGISLLNKCYKDKVQTYKSPPIAKYDEAVRLSLVLIWNATNRICSKRLKPFLPEIIERLEKHKHLSLTDDVRYKLLTISTGTIDKLLKNERTEPNKRTVNTTRCGALLKKQIKVRTFSDWNDVTPGFFEADLVAHCGGSSSGAFLNTLTLTDIATGWTELFPLICKNKDNVIEALKAALNVVMFPILGLDTDNGTEFINYALVKFCEDNNITFTRSRAYKKNDQAHVEEKNGSIVRRIVGYDRFEGVAAWQALTELYSSVRLYVNFFQPSLKLLSKQRDGAKVTKKYDEAKTPYKRLVTSKQISEDLAKHLEKMYENLDPVFLLNDIKEKQALLWKHSWITDDNKNLIAPNNNVQTLSEAESNHDTSSITSFDQYHSTKKPRKQPEKPRHWRTRLDPFGSAWDIIEVQLKLNPNLSGKDLMNYLINLDPIKYKESQLRTMQRKVAEWREQYWQEEKEIKLTAVAESNYQTEYISLVFKTEAIINKVSVLPNG